MRAMRYHKATAISAPVVTYILESAWVSLNPSPVINLFDRWFDTRQMTEPEVRDFTVDFVRKAVEAIRAGLLKPH